LSTMPSQLRLWIVFPQNSMVTYYLSFLLCVICWDIINNCKVRIESTMVMLGASCKPITSIIHLDWASEWGNALDICVVRMIIVLCFNVLMCTMKLVGLAIVPIYQYLGSISWNPLSIPLAVSSATFHPPIYKLEVLKCIMLFINFQFFQKPWSTWGTHSHPITKEMCRKSFREMKNMVADEVYYTPTATSSVIFFLWIRLFFFITCSKRMDKVLWSFSKVKN
jgi:hypothetical protein